MRRQLQCVFFAIAALGATTTVASAQAPDESAPSPTTKPPTPSTNAVAATISDSVIYAWSAPPVEAQVAKDKTEVPPTYGSVFVPTITTPSNEPEVLVFTATGKRVRRSPTGRRIALPPGRYTVAVGSGAPKQMMRQQVEVRGGETTVLPVNWSALRVMVVDNTNAAITGRYELIRVKTRESFGAGFGVVVPLGEELDTWLLPPGLYRLVRAGSGYRARTNFATVYLPAGGLARFRLVQDRRTGTFLGGGVVPQNELGLRQIGKSNWSRLVVLGIDGSFAQSVNVPGIPNQSVFSGNVFLDANANYQKGRHSAGVTLELEQGIVRVNPAVGPSLPTTKSMDGLILDGTYRLATGDTWGPYARLLFDTRLRPTDVLASSDTTITRIAPDDSRTTEIVSANGTFRVAKAFSPLRLRESAGVNYGALRSRVARLSLRTGFGLRQNWFRDTFVEDDDDTTPEIEYREVETFQQVGLEGGVRLIANPTRTTLFRSTLDVFADFLNGGNPTVEWKNTLSLRVTSFISVDYSLDVMREPRVTDGAQVEHGGVVRFSWTLW